MQGLAQELLLSLCLALITGRFGSRVKQAPSVLCSVGFMPSGGQQGEPHFPSSSLQCSGFCRAWSDLGRTELVSSHSPLVPYDERDPL